MVKKGNNSENAQKRERSHEFCAAISTAHEPKAAA
jgi:hypothetical protein